MVSTAEKSKAPLGAFDPLVREVGNEVSASRSPYSSNRMTTWSN
jgi:hypothetical protein